jgi:ribosomal protein L11 methyltransferase
VRLVEIETPASAADLAADRLWTAGAAAVEELPAVGGRVTVRSVLSADDEVSIGRLGALPSAWTVRFVDVDDAPSEAWRDFASPIVVNDELVVRPAWVEFEPGPGVSVIAIEPAGSFGLGDHPTTRLSADAVWRVTRTGHRVLDVGCGSGVLSIAAALRGARAVTAIDVAEAAREATAHNARSHGVEDRIEASCSPLADVHGTFDVVVANILAPTIVELAADLRRVVAPGGRLIVSGILAGRHDHVLTALAPMRCVRTEELDAWACVELVSEE